MNDALSIQSIHGRQELHCSPHFCYSEIFQLFNLCYSPKVKTNSKRGSLWNWPLSTVPTETLRQNTHHVSMITAFRNKEMTNWEPPPPHKVIVLLLPHKFVFESQDEIEPHLSVLFCLTWFLSHVIFCAQFSHTAFLMLLFFFCFFTFS